MAIVAHVHPSHALHDIEVDRMLSKPDVLDLGRRVRVHLLVTLYTVGAHKLLRTERTVMTLLAVCAIGMTHIAVAIGEAVASMGGEPLRRVRHLCDVAASTRQTRVAHRACSLLAQILSPMGRLPLRNEVILRNHLWAWLVVGHDSAASMALGAICSRVAHGAAFKLRRCTLAVLAGNESERVICGNELKRRRVTISALLRGNRSPGGVLCPVTPIAPEHVGRGGLIESMGKGGVTSRAFVVALQMRTVGELHIGIGQIINCRMAGNAQRQRRDCIGVHNHGRQLWRKKNRPQIDRRYRISLDVQICMTYVTVLAGVMTHHAPISTLLVREIRVWQFGPVFRMRRGPELVLGCVAVTAKGWSQSTLFAMRKPVAQEARLHKRKHRAIPKVRR